jgi:hypothetical protein
MLVAILPPLLPPRRSMLLASQASTTAVVVDAQLLAPQETTEGPMPEGKRLSAEDSAGPTVVPLHRRRVEPWRITLVDDGALPRQLGPCPNEVEPFPWDGSAEHRAWRAERILLGSVRIFRALNR